MSQGVPIVSDCMSGRDVPAWVLRGQQGPIGAQITLPAIIAPATTGRPEAVVSWRAPDDVPRTVAIHLFANRVDSGSNIRHRAFATVMWGSLGAKFTIEIDLIRGTSFSVVASSIDITATNESQAVVADPLGLARIPVAGLLCPDGQFDSNNLDIRRSQFVALGAVALVPNFATEIDVIAVAGTVIDFLQDGGVVVASVTIPAGQTMTPRRIPIPNDADSVTASQDMTVFFYLSV